MGKENVIVASRILIKRGICEAFGHVSARLPEGELFVITPKTSMDLIQGLEDLVTVNLKGERVEGKNVQPIYFSEQEVRERGTQLLESLHILRAWEHYKAGCSRCKGQPIR